MGIYSKAEDYIQNESRKKKRKKISIVTGFSPLSASFPNKLTAKTF